LPMIVQSDGNDQRDSGLRLMSVESAVVFG
jgi:hypothetical protein